MCNCSNCSTIKRWDEVYYKPYLKDHPEGLDYINRWRETDRKYLPCSREIEEQARKDFDEIMKKVTTDTVDFTKPHPSKGTAGIQDWDAFAKNYQSHLPCNKRDCEVCERMEIACQY